MGGKELCFIAVYLSSEAHRPRAGPLKTHKNYCLRYTPGGHSSPCKASGFPAFPVSGILNGEDHPEFKHPIKKTEEG